MWASAHKCRSLLRSKASVVSHLEQMLESELGTFRRVPSALNHIPPGPCSGFLTLYILPNLRTGVVTINSPSQSYVEHYFRVFPDFEKYVMQKMKMSFN